MLQAFRSRLRRRTSRTAILCISSVGNRLGEKFSIGPSLATNNCNDPGFIIFTDSVSRSCSAVSSVEGLAYVEIFDLGELSGLLNRCWFEYFLLLGCRLKDSKPEIRFLNSSDTTEFVDM